MRPSSGHAERGQLEPRHLWVQAESIVRISRVVSDLERSESFYRTALGFRSLTRAAPDPEVLSALGLPGAGATEVRMRLGSEELALLRFESVPRNYPADSQSNDLWFQHLAIVVSDMDAAYGHLRASVHWRPISTDGPETLPASSGGVRAFKFRDPDGHPLELLWLPPRSGRPLWHGARRADALEPPFLGIDHSALAVSSTRRSLAFYRALGLHVVARSMNTGPAQSRLDALNAVRVRVTGLRPASVEGPGVELLAYRPPGRARNSSTVTDLSTDWITLSAITAGGAGTSLPRTRALIDPDGHRVVLKSQRGGSFGRPA
ncbi:MAG TPA: VOC family protein [Steroidobacteraceae bacterium]|jgi:catechol 2,3-dioxygenase-like lactoylglutathione lyase family enzyme|nr:VOC family protein [Steroidobacteraceae bacterium]